MFDLGWAEMAVIMLVALIVIGPKDLPKVARTIGQWTGKARALARDFQRSLDDMARDAELDEIKKSIDKAGHFDLKRSIKDAVDPEDEFDRAFELDDEMKETKPAKAKSATAKSAKVKASNVKNKAIAKPPADKSPDRSAAGGSGSDGEGDPEPSAVASDADDTGSGKGSSSASAANERAANERAAGKVEAGAAAERAASSRG